MGWLLVSGSAVVGLAVLAARTSSPATGITLMAFWFLSLFVALRCWAVLQTFFKGAREAHDTLKHRLPHQALVQVMKRIQERRSTLQLERTGLFQASGVRDFESAWQEAKQLTQEDRARRSFP